MHTQINVRLKVFSQASQWIFNGW